MSQLRFVGVLALAVFIAAMVSAGDAKAKGAKVYNTKGTASGTNTSVPIDISGDSCTLVSTIEICTATSSLGIYSGTSSGGPPGTTGAYTGQSILQTIPVAGVGCSFAPETIASCKIGSNTNGCSYKYVNVDGVGGAGANRLSSNGNIGAFYITGGTYCYDPNTFAYEGTNTAVSAGGTGPFATVEGTATTTFSGKVLLQDPAGNGINWFTQTTTGTATAN
jgi:hypothetical protein